VASCDEGVAEWAVLDVAAADGLIADQVFAGVASVGLVISEDHTRRHTGGEHHFTTLAPTGPTCMYMTWDCKCQPAQLCGLHLLVSGIT